MLHLTESSTPCGGDLMIADNSPANLLWQSKWNYARRRIRLKSAVGKS